MPTPLRDITIYLLQNGTPGPDGGVDQAHLPHLRRLNLRDGLPFTGALYVQPQKAGPPSWQDFVNEGLVNADALRLQNRHAGALLVLRVVRHWFAIPFGFGRHLINDDAIELGFGLRATLNSVDPEHLRSVDLSTIEEMRLHTRRQASQTTGLEAFGINITRDLLGGVTGRPRDSGLGQVLTGKDACTLHGPVAFEQLGDRCKLLLDAYSRDDYKARFGWIDQMRAVEDVALVDSLDGELLAALVEHRFDRVHLAAPDQVDWESVSGFRYSLEARGTPIHAELDVADYIDAFEARARNPLDVARLRRTDKVQVFGGPTDSLLEAWSIYRCCVFETTYAGQRFALSGGTWFQVEATFAADIAQQVGTIAEFAQAELGLPDALPGEHEEVYLERAAPLMSVTMGMPVVVMDQRLVRAADAASDIEVCDLFTAGRQFIHAKRRTRSSTLSHLFAQGMASAQAFVSDQRFRELARAKIAETACGTEEFFPTAKPVAGDYTVVFAIIAAGAGALGPALPFLSQINLTHAARQIRGWGYEIAITRVRQI